MRVNFLNLLCAGFMLFCATSIFAQISEGGMPPSFKYQQALRSATTGVAIGTVDIKATAVPVNFYAADLEEIDSWRAREGSPMPIAKLIAVDYTIDNSGQWTTLAGGERIWRLRLKAGGAIATMLYYDDFYLPEGSQLFVYSADKEQVLGAYTHRAKPQKGGRFATTFIAGDDIVLEYVAAPDNDEKPRINIGEIGYGYNRPSLSLFCNVTTRAESESCQVDINCEEGSAWQNEKKGICHTVQKVGDRAYICSGSLMNNTAVDFKPYILMAYHCSVDDKAAVASAEDMEQWVFHFNFEREGCNVASPAPVRNIMVGCKLAARTMIDGQSDGLLVLLNGEMPESYDVFYNGWDRRDIPAASGVSIHHPSGDYKKISTFTKSAQTATFVSNTYSSARNAHWNVIFAATANGHGVTEGGSSGSPLFNENKLVVGSLTGGSSKCSYPAGLNLYGKLAYHWNKYAADSSTRMDVWLDPVNSGVETLQGRFRKVLKPAPNGMKAVNQGSGIYLSWNAPAYDQTPVYYNVYRNNVKIGETTILSFLDAQPAVGSHVYAVSAVYADDEESAFTTVVITYIKYNPPTGLTANRRGTSNYVDVSWNAPVNEQTIYWGSLDPMYSLGFTEDDGTPLRDPFYFGQRWSVSDIMPLVGKTIRAIQFIPIENNVYEVYIQQDEYIYRQAISEPYRKGQLITVDLTTPYTISANRPLIVSIYVASVNTDYPAACDMGPAYDGKGNVCSFDGRAWSTVYSDDDPENFDYNFIVSAIVTSETGAPPARPIVTSSGDTIIKTGNRGNQIVVKKISANDLVNVSMRSSTPEKFVEVTSYKIYRDGSYLRGNDVTAPNTTYVDNTPKSYVYEVSAVYEGSIESGKAYTSNDGLFVDVDIYPSYFSTSVALKGFGYISRVEAISAAGRVMLSIDNPDDTINVSSLPPGVYFFRLYEGDTVRKVVRAIKGK